MSGFQTPITINAAMQHIKDKEYLLPAFQREYVWKQEQVESFFDSLMRGYPINSMLFWRVKDESKTTWKFYDFLKYYRERYHTHNEPYDTTNHKDFYAILDGQQRLTSLYLALFGHYDIHRRYQTWQNQDKYFEICSFYFNLTQIKKEEDGNVKYEFLWLDKKITNEQAVYTDKNGQKWFLCKYLYHYDSSRVRRISKEFHLNDDEENMLDLLYEKIFNQPLIHFYLEEEQSPDKAVNIFIRINSGGTNLNYSDILFGMAVADWRRVDARKEMNEVVDYINYNFGFNISKDLVLKSFLYLFHNNIRFNINNFDKKFIESVEEKWENIKESLVETFRLLKTFGFNAKTLGSNNAVLPILYFIYHKGLTKNIVDSATQTHKDNRQLMKKWLLRVMILKPFGRSPDNALLAMRRTFVKDFKQNSVFFDRNIESFPLQEIEKEAKYARNIDETFLQDNVIWERKNSPQAFATLSLLYPHLDYKNNNFHKDHLHPESAYKQYEKMGKEKQKQDPEYYPYEFQDYDSVVNLQMLDSNENESKNAKPLKQWVEENCGNDRVGFLERHLIPDVDLSLENFDEFMEAREELLVEKLLALLNA